MTPRRRKPQDQGVGLVVGEFEMEKPPDAITFGFLEGKSTTYSPRQWPEREVAFTVDGVLPANEQLGPERQVGSSKTLLPAAKPSGNDLSTEFRTPTARVTPEATLVPRSRVPKNLAPSRESPELQRCGSRTQNPEALRSLSPARANARRETSAPRAEVPDTP